VEPPVSLHELAIIIAKEPSVDIVAATLLAVVVVSAFDHRLGDHLCFIVGTHLSIDIAVIITEEDFAVSLRVLLVPG